MLTKLSIDELFQIAESMEVDGQQFYSLAAEKTQDAELKKQFSDLADWEKEHIKVFRDLAKMVKNGNDSTDRVADPQSDVDEYLHALVKGAVFELADSAEEAIANISTPLELLRYACEMEKKAVLFYMGIREALPESMHRAITPIIEEETRHIVFINRLILNLPDKQ